MSEAEADLGSAEVPSTDRPSAWLTACVALGWVVIDQLTKRWALATLERGEPQHVVWTLQWNLSFNSGMAFGTGTGLGPVIGVVALLVVVWLAASVRHVDSRLARVAAGMVVGGAIGNLLDRVFRGDGLLDGAVVDFIDLQWFPWIFNIADMGITVGGALFVVWSFTSHRGATST
jgi:signal peptidase II